MPRHLRRAGRAAPKPAGVTGCQQLAHPRLADAKPLGSENRVYESGDRDLRPGLELLIEEVGIPDELTLTLNVA
jgi:hypothetical protein